MKNKPTKTTCNAEADKEEITDELDMRAKRFLRGNRTNLQGLRDKKLKGRLSVREKLYQKSAQAAAKIEKWLLPSEGGYLEAEGIEKTWRIKQESLIREVDISSTKNVYDMKLPDLAPYRLDFTSNGSHMALCGRKGHIAILELKKLKLVKEFQVRETVHDVVFLHDESSFAAAQKKYAYIYDKKGTEIHCLKEHEEVLRLQYLKQHFLLSTINTVGQLSYQDITCGQMVNRYRTGFGRTDVMQVNPYNGVVALGHSLGTVSMWKPTSSTYLCKQVCHRGPISAMAFHSDGRLMATAGKEQKIKLWDLRKLQDEPLQTLQGNTITNTLDFSQKGLLAAGSGWSVQVLRDVHMTQDYEEYMNPQLPDGFQVENVMFRPYEDVLCIGHSMGWSSRLIPGSGEPNYDSMVANPFETPKQRSEKLVQSLLVKLLPETIMLDPTKIGTVKPSQKKKEKAKIVQEKEAAVEAVIKGIVLKKKTKGRNKPSKKTTKKKEIIANAKRPLLELQMKEEEQVARKKLKTPVEAVVELPTSLQRFARKKAATA